MTAMTSPRFNDAPSAHDGESHFVMRAQPASFRHFLNRTPG
jgi:hypothetical protein